MSKNIEEVNQQQFLGYFSHGGLSRLYTYIHNILYAAAEGLRVYMAYIFAHNLFVCSSIHTLEDSTGSSSSNSTVYF